jgi:hypothetical protein
LLVSQMSHDWLTDRHAVPREKPLSLCATMKCAQNSV